MAQFVALALAWAVGDRLSLRLDASKRQTELDRQALAALYELYGDFFINLKRWSDLKDSDAVVQVLDDRRYALLDDAYKAEGQMEAPLVKVAAEQPLQDADCELLGLLDRAISNCEKQYDTIERWHGEPRVTLIRGLQVAYRSGLSNSSPVEPSCAESNAQNGQSTSRHYRQST